MFIGNIGTKSAAFINHKPFHPGNLRNLEKVWLAEEKHKKDLKAQEEMLERRKQEVQIEELRKALRQKDNATGGSSTADGPSPFAFAGEGGASSAAGGSRKRRGCKIRSKAKKKRKGGDDDAEAVAADEEEKPPAAAQKAADAERPPSVKAGPPSPARGEEPNSAAQSGSTQKGGERAAEMAALLAKYTLTNFTSGASSGGAPATDR